MPRAATRVEAGGRVRPAWTFLVLWQALASPSSREPADAACTICALQRSRPLRTPKRMPAVFGASGSIQFSREGTENRFAKPFDGFPCMMSDHRVVRFGEHIEIGPEPGQPLADDHFNRLMHRLR